MTIVEARMPDGTLADLVEVNLTKSGLLIMVTDADGNQTFIHRYAWDGVVKEVNALLEEEKRRARSAVVDLKGGHSEETKVCDDRQIEKRSNSAIGRSSEDEERQTSQASVGISLSSYLAQMPDHPLARETEKWITSMGKCLADVLWWEIRDGAMAALYLRKAHVSVQFRGSATRHFCTFLYDEREASK